MSDGDENAAARQRIYRWRDERARDSACTCEPIGFSESGEWRLKAGELVHRTGRFFSVVGARTVSSDTALDGLCQPFILQSEQGSRFLGKFDRNCSNTSRSVGKASGSGGASSGK